MVAKLFSTIVREITDECLCFSEVVLDAKTKKARSIYLLCVVEVCLRFVVVLLLTGSGVAAAALFHGCFHVVVGSCCLVERIVRARLEMDNVGPVGYIQYR